MASGWRSAVLFNSGDGDIEETLEPDDSAYTRRLEVLLGAIVALWNDDDALVLGDFDELIARAEELLEGQ